MHRYIGSLNTNEVPAGSGTEPRSSVAMEAIPLRRSMAMTTRRKAISNMNVDVKKVTGNTRAGAVGNTGANVKKVAGNMRAGAVGNTGANVKKVAGNIRAGAVGNTGADVKKVAGNMYAGAVGNTGADVKKVAGNMRAGAVGNTGADVKKVAGNMYAGAVGTSPMMRHEDRSPSDQAQVPQEDRACRARVSADATSSAEGLCWDKGPGHPHRIALNSVGA